MTSASRVRQSGDVECGISDDTRRDHGCRGGGGDDDRGGRGNDDDLGRNLDHGHYLVCGDTRDPFVTMIRVMRSPAATGHTSTTGPMAWKGATATTAMIATAVAITLATTARTCTVASTTPITLATTHGRDRDGRSDHFGHYREDRYSHEHKCSENPLSHLQWANLILSPG